MSEDIPKGLCIWYSPEEENIRESTKEDGYLFKDEFGEFHMWVANDLMHYKSVKYYYIGEI